MFEPISIVNSLLNSLLKWMNKCHFVIKCEVVKAYALNENKLKIQNLTAEKKYCIDKCFFYNFLTTCSFGVTYNISGIKCITVMPVI